MALNFSHLLVALVAGAAGALWMHVRRRREEGDARLFPMPQTRMSERTLSSGEQAVWAAILLGWLIAWGWAIAFVLGVVWQGDREVTLSTIAWLVASKAAWGLLAYALWDVVRGRWPFLQVVEA